MCCKQTVLDIIKALLVSSMMAYVSNFNTISNCAIFGDS